MLGVQYIKQPFPSYLTLSEDLATLTASNRVAEFCSNFSYPLFYRDSFPTKLWIRCRWLEDLVCCGILITACA